MELKTEQKLMLDTGFVNRLSDLPITNREKEVLVHLAKGNTNKDEIFKNRKVGFLLFSSL